MNISLKIGFQKFDIDSIIESLNGGPWELEGSKGYDEDELDDIMEMATIRKAEYLTTTNEESFTSFLTNFRKDIVDSFGDKSICFMAKTNDLWMVRNYLQFDKRIYIRNNDYWVVCFFNKE